LFKGLDKAALGAGEGATGKDLGEQGEFVVAESASGGVLVRG
jgi:hypothetical protein